MNTSVKHYRQLLTQMPGDHLQKIKTLLENHMDSWYLIDADLVIDLLDDTSITAADLVEILKGVAEFDADNVGLKNAVIAMELTLKNDSRQKASSQSIDETLLNDETLYENDHIIAFYSQLGFDNGMRLAG